MMMKHTQGPWAVSNYYAGKASISGKDWGGFATVVTRLDGDENDSVEGLANARLIAAAPDLLAALEDMLNLTLDEDDIAVSSRIAKARAAIAKAKGEA